MEEIERKIVDRLIETGDEIGGDVLVFANDPRVGNLPRYARLNWQFGVPLDYQKLWH
ncbi:MAG: hypothetical protein DHS20C16_03880 [Phycisphaerae bacterium]|nr:MAG: hypothetical protein DHS20C16_03880 [Phycisphaerae bacterium]